MAGTGRRDRLLAQLLGGRADANVSFEAICALLRRLGFHKRTRGSHHVFRRKGVEEPLNLQRDGAKAKVCQIRQARAVLVRYGLTTIERGRRVNAYKYELIVYWSAEDMVFVADVPELPGCMAHGATPAEMEARCARILWKRPLQKLASGEHFG